MTTTKEQLLSRIVSYISYKPRTYSEVLSKLEQYLKDSLTSEISEVDKDAVKEAVVNQLLEMRLLNDRQYCERYIEEQLRSSKPKSPLEIKVFLSKRGVQMSLIESTLVEFGTDLVSNSLAKIINKNTHRSRQQLINYLLRKGYSYDTILSALNTDLTMNSN